MRGAKDHPTSTEQYHHPKKDSKQQAYAVILIGCVLTFDCVPTGDAGAIFVQFCIEGETFCLEDC